MSKVLLSTFESSKGLFLIQSTFEGSKVLLSTFEGSQGLFQSFYPFFAEKVLKVLKSTFSGKKPKPLLD